MEKQQVRVNVLQKDVFGSLSGDGYSDDTLMELKSWIDSVLETIPPEYRQSAQIDVDSVGGYEGEHHVEIEVYYRRLETDEELAARQFQEQQRQQQDKQHELAVLAHLQKKYRTTPESP